MKSAKSFSIVLVTAPNLKVARRLASAALEQKCIACANLIPRLESHYWWQGKIEKGSEILMILKAPTRTLSKLEALVHELHPYDTPEFLTVGLDKGSARYLDWLQASTK